MCNACHNVCCGSDQFEKCGCDGCECEECWSDEPEDMDDDDYFDGEPQMDLLNMDFYGEWLCGKCETLIAPNSEISIETTVFNQDGKDWIYHMAVHPACLN